MEIGPGGLFCSLFASPLLGFRERIPNFGGEIAPLVAGIRGSLNKPAVN